MSPSLSARDYVADEISLASCLITQKSRRILPKQATRAPPSLTLLYRENQFCIGCDLYLVLLAIGEADFVAIVPPFERVARDLSLYGRLSFATIAFNTTRSSQ